MALRLKIIFRRTEKFDGVQKAKSERQIIHYHCHTLIQSRCFKKFSQTGDWDLHLELRINRVNEVSGYTPLNIFWTL